MRGVGSSFVSKSSPFPPSKKVSKIPETRCSLELKDALDAYCNHHDLKLSQVVTRAIYLYLHIENFDFAKYNQDYGLPVSEKDDAK